MLNKNATLRVDYTICLIFLYKSFQRKPRNNYNFIFLPILLYSLDRRKILSYPSFKFLPNPDFDFILTMNKKLISKCQQTCIESAIQHGIVSNIAPPPVSHLRGIVGRRHGQRAAERRS